MPILAAGENAGFPHGVAFRGDIGRLPSEGARPAHGVGVLSGPLGGPAEE